MDPSIHLGQQPVAEGYRRFAEREARGVSDVYTDWATRVATDSGVLELLQSLPGGKKQPNLVFAAARWHGAAGSYDSFRSTVLEHWDQVRATIMARATQTNEAGRCATLLPFLATLPQPLALLEVGAAAGLCLLPDQYSYSYDDGTHLDPSGGRSPVVIEARLGAGVPRPAMPQVAWRAGIDLNPIDAGDADARAWLETLIWPGQEARRHRLRAALDIAARERPRVIRGDLLHTLPDLAAQAPPDATLVVFHSAVLAYLDSSARERFTNLVADLPGHWMSNEGRTVLPVSADLDVADTGAFVLTVDGVPRALTDPHGRAVSALTAAQVRRAEKLGLGPSPGSPVTSSSSAGDNTPSSGLDRTMTASTRVPPVRASELRGRGWLNTGGAEVSLQHLRGKIVLLDFWTFCCINCLHVIDELRDLTEQFADVLVTIGVHSPKFVHEADPEALAAAIERYDVTHPVLDDPDLVTWKAYTARAWPTLVLIDPEGYIVAHMAGEGHAPNLRALINSLITEHEAKGTLHRGEGPYVPPEPSTGLLKFPAEAIRLPNGNLFIADAGHHRLVETEPDGATPVRIIGSGTRGHVDGDAASARFSEPNGLCLLPPHVAAQVGYDVVVADTVNHLLRGVALDTGAVTTIAGTGEQFMLGAPDNVRSDESDHAPVTEDYGPGLRIKLSSPWDVTWAESAATAGAVVIAMAGHHTVWTFEPADGYLTRLGGTMNEGLVDGPLRQAWFAQPSGLAAGADGTIWLADAETSALRWLDLGAGQVHTAIGEGLFEFGHRDGPAGQALLQHPLGVLALPDGQIVVADTYNGAVRGYDPASGQVSTLATGLAEPSGLLVATEEASDGGAHLIVVESAAHRLTRVPLGKAATHDGGAHRTQREVTDVGPQVRLRVLFTPPPGRTLDDRFGPSTQLEVGATQAALVHGAGTGTELHRDLTLRPGAEQVVLSVTAKAASCEDDPAVEFPACHLTAQDWGIPVRVVPGGPAELVLNLAG